MRYIHRREDGNEDELAAKVLPEPGTTVKTTTFTETLPQNVQKEKNDLTFWDYMAQLKPEEYSNHMVYVYQWLDQGEYAPLTKLAVPFDEFGLKEAIGGGSFMLMMKKGPQLCKRINRYFIPGKPKDPNEISEKTSSNTSGHQSDIAAILARQTDLIALLEKVILQNNSRPVVDEAFRGALELQKQGFSSVVSSVRDLTPAPVGTPATDPMRELTMQFMGAAISKMLNPADPIEAFSKMATAFTSLNLGGGGNSSLGAELIRALPAVAQHVSSGIQAYTAAQLEAARLASQPQPQRPALPNGQPQTITVAAQTSPASAQPTEQAKQPQPPAPPPQGGDVAVPNVEWLEDRIVAIIMNQELSVTEAASEALTFLQVAAPNVRDQLVASGEAGLNFLFSNRTILMRVPKNPRLSEFITKFLEMGSGMEPTLPTEQVPDQLPNSQPTSAS